MNKKIFFPLFLLALSANILFAAGKKDKTAEQPADENITVLENDKNNAPLDIDSKTGFPKIKQRPFIMFNEGAAYTLITRLEKQEKRSNFVRQNHLVGLFFSAQTENMKPVNSMIRIAAYYPFFNTFNGMRQYPKQTILYAFDLLAAPMIQADMWKYVRLNFAGGLHYMYQLTDEYHMNYLGGGLLAGVELPLARRWTVLTDGTATLDYPNLGTNRLVQPFDFAWQYNVSVGVRYSKKGENKYAYIHKITPKKRKAKKNIEADQDKSNGSESGNAAPETDNTEIIADKEN